MYEGRRRYDEGDALRKRALAIIERAYGTESIPFAKSLKALGGVYGQQGRNKEALALLLRAWRLPRRPLVRRVRIYTHSSPISVPAISPRSATATPSRF